MVMLRGLTGRAAESLAGPWAVEPYDNMADAYCVEGQVPGEDFDEYPSYDHARHVVRARAVELVPRMLSLLERAGELAQPAQAAQPRSGTEQGQVERGTAELGAEIGELFGELEAVAKRAESSHPREVT